MAERPERVAHITYYENRLGASRWIEMSDEMVQVFEAWAASHETRLEWTEESPYGLVVEFQEWRQLLARMRALLQVKVDLGDFQSLAVLRAAVAHLETCHGQQK